MKKNITDLTKDMGWTERDDSSCQRCRQLGFGSKKFELLQIDEVGETFLITHEIVNLDDYSHKEIEDVLKIYEYDNFNDFVKQNDPDVEEIDRIIYYQYIAEMIFETKSKECSEDNIFTSYEEAVKKVNDITGPLY